MQIDFTAIFVALTGVTTALGILYKTKVSAYNKLLDSLMATIDEMKIEMKAQKEEIEKLRLQIDLLKDYEDLLQLSMIYIRDVCTWLDTLGITAEKKPFMPPSLKKHYGPFVMKNHKEKEE